MSEASAQGAWAGGASGQAEPDPRRWLILVIIAVAQLMIVLDLTVMNLALPSAQKALGFSDVDRQWIVTAYALSFGSLLLFCGRLADLIGRKVMFLTGLTGFAVASAIGGASVNFEMLVTARACQGVFAAMLAPAALSLLTTTFTDPKERGKAFGVYGAIAGAGAAVGLLLGGVLTSYLSWRWCLYINLFFAGIAITGGALWLHKQQKTTGGKLDIPGVLLVGAGLFGIFLFLTYYMQVSLAYSPVISGLAFLPMVACVAVAANVANIVLLPRIGPKPIVIVAFLLLTGGQIWLTRIGVRGDYVADIPGPLMITGTGMGLLFSTAINTGTYGVDPQDAGVASASVNTGQQLGGSIGTSLLNTIAASATTAYITSHLASLHTRPTPATLLAVQAAGFVHGYTTVFWWCTGLFVAGAVICGLLMRSGPLQGMGP